MPTNALVGRDPSGGADALRLLEAEAFFLAEALASTSSTESALPGVDGRAARTIAIQSSPDEVSEL